MGTYKVGFFKQLVNSNGKAVNCLQRVVEIHRARNADRAVKAAKYRYARRFGARDWNLYADSFELQLESPAPGPASASHHTLMRNRSRAGAT